MFLVVINQDSTFQKEAAILPLDMKQTWAFTGKPGYYILDIVVVYQCANVFPRYEAFSPSGVSIYFQPKILAIFNRRQRVALVFLELIRVPISKGVGSTSH